MKVLIAIGLAGAALAGCSQAPQRWETRGDRVLGIGAESAEDPVSGVSIAKKDAIRRDYKGTTYYFESTQTASTFMEHPSEYAIPESEGRESRIDVR
jgi:YHS domain-containing protein